MNNYFSFTGILFRETTLPYIAYMGYEVRQGVSATTKSRSLTLPYYLHTQVTARYFNNRMWD